MKLSAALPSAETVSDGIKSKNLSQLAEICKTRALDSTYPWISIPTWMEYYLFSFNCEEYQTPCFEFCYS